MLKCAVGLRHGMKPNAKLAGVRPPVVKNFNLVKSVEAHNFADNHCEMKDKNSCEMSQVESNALSQRQIHGESSTETSRKHVGA